MSESQNHPRNESFDTDAGPEAFVWVPEERSVNRESAAGRGGRKIPINVLAAIAVVALLLGGVGGYLLGRGAHDTSVAGQVSYACVLIENVQKTHKTPEDWGDIFEDEAYKDVSAASTLLGGFLPFDEHVERDLAFPKLGSQLLSSLSQLDAEMLTTAVKETHQACQDR